MSRNDGRADGRAPRPAGRRPPGAKEPEEGGTPRSEEALASTEPEVVAAEEGEEEEGEEEEGEHRQARAPWHFKVIAVGTVIYLGYRLYQGIGWLAHHL